MRPTASRLVPLALVAVALVSSACGSAASSSSAPTAAGSASPAAVVSAAPPSAASSIEPSASAASSPVTEASPSAPASPAATPTATPARTPKPTANATPKPPTGLLCVNLLRNSEVRAATGLTDATLVRNANAKPDEAGQTKCVYAAQGGQVTITAAVWTNSSLVTFFNLWDQVLGYSGPVDGIGQKAIIDAGDGTGLAQVGKKGISIQIKGPSGVPVGVDALTACETLLKLLAKRI